MASTVFMKQDVEINYSRPGLTVKQTFPNVKEDVDSEKMVALGQLFIELLPSEVEMTGVIGVKRMRYEA